MKNGKAKVIIGGPEKLTVSDMNALKGALVEGGACVTAFRADVMFHSEQFEGECKGKTHFVLFVDDDVFPYERQMIAAAKAAKVSKMAVICLGSVNALARYKQLFISGRADIVVTRSHSDHAIKGRVLEYDVPCSLVAEDLANAKSAKQIARAVLAGWRR